MVLYMAEPASRDRVVASISPIDMSMPLVDSMASIRVSIPAIRESIIPGPLIMGTRF